ncbi:MAG: transposase family protein [Rhodospirillales bacterium]|nr:transposase family protein [Rhodospirillales bacterium]
MDGIVKWYEEVVGGKPWPDRPRMLIAVDGYSRAVLAWCICFLNESGEMVLLVIRDLVRRHHRVPDISLFDNGSGFISGVLRRVLVGACRRTVAFRPPHAPKFSGQEERAFREHQDQLLRNMAGYTGRLRKRRMVTKKFDPRQDAVWGLDGLMRLTAAFFALYNDTVNTEIGMTPNQALEEGWKLRGLRTDQKLVYDEQVRRATLPSTSREHVLDPQKGFYFLGNRYRNPAASGRFTRKPVHERSFYLRFDPEDAAVVFARIKGRLEAFRCDAADRLDAFAVPGDRRLVSLTMPIEKRDARREERLGNDRLTDMLDAIDEAQEETARTRREELERHSSDDPARWLAGDEAAGGMEPEDGEPRHPLAYLDKTDDGEGEVNDADAG